MIELHIGVHGKLTDQGDFVTHGVGRDDVELIDRCFGALSEAAGETALDAAGPVCAAQRLGGDWLLTTWLPSRDAVGRRYPLVAVSRLPADAAGHDQAAAWALFVPIFERVLGGLAGGVDHERLAALVSELEAQIEPQRVVEMGHHRLSEERSKSLWRQAWGDDWEAESRRALGNFHQLVTAGHELLRIDGVTSTSHVAFWYTAACLLRGDGAPPDLVVLHPTSSGGAPRLYLGWGRFDPDQLAACLWDVQLGAWLSNVPSVPGRQDHTPAWLDEALDQAGPSLSDLLYVLSHPEPA